MVVVAGCNIAQLHSSLKARRLRMDDLLKYAAAVDAKVRCRSFPNKHSAEEGRRLSSCLSPLSLSCLQEDSLKLLQFQQAELAERLHLAKSKQRLVMCAFEAASEEFHNLGGRITTSQVPYPMQYVLCN